jgi:hypothetical protein
MDLDRVKKLRYELHNIPEISENEIKTQELLKKYIKNNSKLKIVEKDGYFYAVHYEGENLKNMLSEPIWTHCPVKTEHTMAADMTDIRLFWLNLRLIRTEKALVKTCFSFFSRQKKSAKVRKNAVKCLRKRV